MAEHSRIGWTHHTMNFWWGCDKVSSECTHCYIGPIMKRAGREPFKGPMRTRDWSGPAKWNLRAGKGAVRERVFTCSMSDFFHEGADPWRGEAWEVIRATKHLDWLILTKRPELVPERLPADWGKGYSNVWLGVTAGCRKSLRRLDRLREIPAALRFLSAEPLLERLDLTPYLGWLDWVITGSEQAARGKRRPMDLAWVWDIDRQCKEYGVCHFFKQAYLGDKGRPSEEPELDGRVVQEVPAGRDRAGRLSLPVV